MSGYVPQQRDLVWLDFDPAKGMEIQKRRPALVVSSTAFNRLTGFIVACPITSSIRKGPQYYDLLQGLKVTGQVVTHQFRSMDATDKGNRNPQYIDRMELEDFAVVAQMLEQVFDFNSILHMY
jgi:mRNA interferase MazF